MFINTLFKNVLKINFYFIYTLEQFITYNFYFLLFSNYIYLAGGG
jgi:hypothetical protein